jgi:hypothetical protein
MRCPPAEILAAMAEDALGRRERESLLDHAADCDECRHALLALGVRSRVRVRSSARSWIPWAVAASLFIAIVGLLAFRGRSDSRPEAPIAEVPAKPETPPTPRPELPRPELPPAPRPEPEAPQHPLLPDAPKPKPQPQEEKPEEKPVVPTPEPEKPVDPEKPVPVRPPTQTVVAVLDRAEGEVFVLGAAGRIAVKAGQSLRPGDGLEIAGAALAQISFPDKTKVEASGDTLIREISDAKGKRIRVEKGTVTADVAKQPEGQPLLFTTPHGEAKVLGTTLRLTVNPDPKKGTRLEVAEGKVEFKNLAGGKTVVESGHLAVAATGVSMASKAAPREEIVAFFDFEDGKLPPGADTGTVVRGPQNRICLAGVDSGGTCKIFIGPAPELFHFEGDEILTFDYWVDNNAEQVNLNIWNRTQKVAHQSYVQKTVLGKWARATFKVAEMGEPGTPRIKEGDIVGNLYVQGTGGPPSRRFYIDNILITRPWSLRLK